MTKPTIQCINVFDEPIDTRPREKRFAATQKRIISYDAAGDNSVLFRRQSPLTWMEELTVVALFLVVMGGPMLLVASFFLLLLLGSWTQLACHVIVTAVLAFHPIPNSPGLVLHPAASFISAACFKYFSYRIMWTGDALQQARTG